MRVIDLDANKKIVGIKNVGNNYVLQVGEIQSDVGELGQIMQPDGSFITPEVVPLEIKPTIEEEILFETKYQTMILETGGM